MVLTFGTGIGSALFLDGRLLPNTEFGHLQVRGQGRRAARLRPRPRGRRAQLGEVGRPGRRSTWSGWSGCSGPDLIIIGGGVSKKADKFLPLVQIDTPIVPAMLQNDAGIIGAALAASGL